MLPFSPVGFFVLGLAIFSPSVVDANLVSGSVDLDFIVLVAVPANAPTVNILPFTRTNRTVYLDIVLLVSTTFGVITTPGIVIDSDTNPRVRLGAGSMTDGNADGACLLKVVRVLGTTTFFQGASAFELNGTRAIAGVLVVPRTDISSITPILRHFGKLVTVGVVFDFTSCAKAAYNRGGSGSGIAVAVASCNTGDEKRKEKELHSCVV
jgi:hypothetical protein